MSKPSRFRWSSLLLLGCSAAALSFSLSAHSRPSPEPAAPSVTLPELRVEQYELENGLTVLLSPDRRIPIVAVEVVYLVGSSHERAGRTGFAHLFEHLMFQGSKHHDTEYFAPFEPIGAQVNGTTSQDRTNYYEHVPAQYAELALWMESDRMRSLLDVLTQEKLDNQRDVVKNERRQRYEVTPYGMAHWHLSEMLYPEGHPYRHTPIGSHEDLTAASLEDVREFFRTYYVASNAALILTGDFEPAQMKPLLEKYFGDIPRGERAPTPVAAPVQMSAPLHWEVEDDVELPRVFLAWHSPALFEEGDAELDLLSAVLAEGKTSRLFQRLVYQKRVAKDVHAYQMSRKIGGVYVVEATAAPGTSATQLGEELTQALKEALASPPTEAELTRARNQYKKDFYHRLESVGDRASLIGSYYLHTGRGDALRQDAERYLKASPQTVMQAGQKFLSFQRSVRLDFIPGKKDSPPRPAATPSSTSQEATP